MTLTAVDKPFVKSEYFDLISQLPEIKDIVVFEDEPTTEDEIVRRIGNAELITQDIYTQITKNVINRAPNLKAIFTQSVGYNNIDVEHAKKKGIPVYNCAGYNANAVAEFVFSLITSLFRKIPAAQAHVRSGGWIYRYFEGNELQGKTIGIVGSGHIGTRVAAIANGYGLKVKITTKHPEGKDPQKYFATNFSSLPELLKESDIVVLTVPLTEETKHLIGAKELSLMKKSAILVNVARHTIVDEYALAEAVINHKIAGAALDFMLTDPFDIKEYPLQIQELINLPNVIVTPHIAGISVESSSSLGEMFVKNIKNYLKGDTTNCVNL